jgi:SagB-type dehydrogenase family enzyme
MPADNHLEAIWPVGLRIRPVTDPESSDVEVADTVAGRRFRWSPESLARYILRGSGGEELVGDRDGWRTALAAARGRDRLVPGWRHWHERAWYPSDQYYVASRRRSFADAEDSDGTVRTTTVEKYLELDGPPAPEEHREAPRFSLGPPDEPGEQDVSRLLVTRRSGRAYIPKPVPLTRLSGLLWHGLAEIRTKRERTSPVDPLSYLDSYGSEWDFYLCVYNVTGLEPGVYRYDVLTHELIGVRPGDHRQVMISVLQGMRSPTTAAWTLGLVADFPRYQWRYRHEHGLRRLYFEAGMLGQELIVLAMSYGLSTLVTPAAKDREYLDLHDLSADRFAPVYTLTMGQSRGTDGVSFWSDRPREQDPTAS